MTAGDGAAAPQAHHAGAAPMLAAALSALIAVTVLAGWTFGISSLKSVLPGAVEMKANTAAGLLAAAAAILLLTLPHSRGRQLAAQAVGAFVALLGLATLAQYVLAWDFGIDELLFRDTAIAYNAYRGRMSPYSAVAFACMGLALICAPLRPLRPFSWMAASAVVLIGALSLLGYVWSASELITDRWLPPVAVNTAIAFILLGSGTLAASLRHEDSSRRRDSAGSTIERRVQAGFLAALVVLFLAASFTYRAGADLADSTGVLLRSQQLRQAVRHIYAALSNAESAQRGYLLTGDEALRRDYFSRIEDMKMYERTVDALAGDDLAQREGISELKTLASSRAAQLAYGLALLEKEGQSAAARHTALAPGTEAMRTLREVTERVAAGEDRRLIEREAELTQRRLLTLVSLVLTMVIATGLLLVLFRGVRREMAARLESERALRKAHDEQKAKEAEILELNTALAQRAADVEAVNKELESFSYSVSHDLRAPLRHISGFLKLLTDDVGDKLAPAPRRYLQVIGDASRQMGRLIDDLLSFSRMTRTDMQHARVDVDAIVRDAIAGMEMASGSRAIEWHVHRLPAVEGDAALLRQVYANLIGNAVKYSAPRDPACIEIGTSGEEGGRAVLFVRDNGVGFDMKHAGKLFGVFQRLHTADEFEGTGIGLATVQRIIARHGGRVWAEATPDQGATFYFTLKKSAGSESAEHLASMP